MGTATPEGRAKAAVGGQFASGKNEEKDLSVTIKAHCIFEHVVQNIERTGHSLGVLSEQAFESVHYDFLETWKRFKYPQDHKEYGQKLLDAVINYNSFHISDDKINSTP